MNDYDCILVTEIHRVEREVLIEMAKGIDNFQKMRGAVAMVEALEAYIAERESEKESATD